MNWNCLEVQKIRLEIIFMSKFSSLSVFVFKKDVHIAQQYFNSRFTDVEAGTAIFIVVMYWHAANTVVVMAVAECQITFYFKFKRSTFQ